MYIQEYCTYTNLISEIYMGVMPPVLSIYKYLVYVNGGKKSDRLNSDRQKPYYVSTLESRV